MTVPNEPEFAKFRKRRADEASIPKNSDGHRVAPRYIPPAQHAYRAQLAQWCRDNPKRPAWLQEAVDREELKL